MKKFLSRCSCSLSWDDNFVNVAPNACEFYTFIYTPGAEEIGFSSAEHYGLATIGRLLQI